MREFANRKEVRHLSQNLKAELDYIYIDLPTQVLRRFI